MLEREPVGIIPDIPGLPPKEELEALLASNELKDKSKAYRGLGIYAMNDGKIEDAYEYIVKASNTLPEWNNLTLLAQISVMMTFPGRKFSEQGLKAARDAALINPDQIRTWIVLGNMNLLTYNFDEAIAAFSRARELAPSGSEDEAKILMGLGHAFDKVGNKLLAIKYYQESLTKDPNNKHVHYLLATRFIDDTHDPEKLAYHAQQAIGGPDGDLAIWNSALGLLATGQWEKGWEYHEVRTRVPEFNGKMVCQNRFPDKPIWDGKSKGRIHIIREQGLGDSLQFVRYLNLLRDYEVQMECNTNMGQLFEHSFPHVKFFPMLNEPTNIPEFDYQLMLMSLPHVLKKPVYWDGPYLKAEQSYVDKWKEILPSKGLKRIGICWAGEKRSHDGRCHQLDGQRSMVWEDIKPLLDWHPDIEWVSLQMGKPLIPSKDYENLIQTSHLIEHFSDTAGIIANLDAVISVDTAVLHLAGAMGARTYLLDKYATCWRWPHKLDERGSTPFYPNMKIIRQSKYMDWTDVVRRMSDELMGIEAQTANRLRLASA